MDHRFSRRQVGQLALAGASAVALAGQARTSLAGVRLQSSWYFAEGSTMRGVDEYLTIVNPNNATAQVFVKYYLGYGTSISMGMSVPKGRMTIPVYENRAGGIGRGQEPIGVVLESMNDIDFVVERPMYFEYGPGRWTGGHVALGAPGGRSTWYFAEGYTGDGFDQYLAIFNPSGGRAEVRITYYLRGGGVVTRAFGVEPQTSIRVRVHESPNDILRYPRDPAYNPGGLGRGYEVATKVESTNGIGIVAERAMYFAYRPDGAADVRWTGGHIAMGAAEPRTRWYFAEGYTGAGFDEYLTIQNPAAGPARVTITYYLDGGQAPGVTSFSVPAQSRDTVAVHDARRGVGRGHGVSALVQSDIPIVVERPMYFAYGAAGWTGGHVVLGVAAPRRAWYFAEGYTASNFDEYLTIQNPSATDTDVRISYYLRGGDTRTRVLRAPANARTTVAVHDPAQGVGRGQEVSALVESLSDVGIIVERPMYFDYAGGDSIFPFRADGGHVTAGFALD